MRINNSVKSGLLKHLANSLKEAIHLNSDLRFKADNGIEIKNTKLFRNITKKSKIKELRVRKDVIYFSAPFMHENSKIYWEFKLAKNQRKAFINEYGNFYTYHYKDI